MSDDRTIRQGLDEVADGAASQLRHAIAVDAVRGSAGRAASLLLIVPAIAVVAQVLRLLSGADAGRLFSWWFVPLLVLPPAIFLAVRGAARHGAAVGRRRALAAVDRELRSGDRLLTADEFLAAPSRDGFMRAAIEDASAYVGPGRDAALVRTPVRIGLSWIERMAAPAAVALLVAAFWLSTIAPRAAAEEGAAPAVEAWSASVEDAEPRDEALPPDAPRERPPMVEPEARLASTQSQSRSNVPISDDMPDGAEEAHGSMGTGKTSESDQSSSPSNARGAPSAQGQPSKAGDPPKKKPSSPRKRPGDRTQQERPEEQEDQPTGSTAGQGSSKGSNKNPAASDWSSRDQVSTPDDDSVEEEDDVEDEEEEQESRGGMQPNLRDRRPPVNRDLRIGFGNRSNPDANGRGGPGQQKKSRGVASFVLGVPLTDRVKGQTNPGKTKVTQQRIQPEFEPTDPATATAQAPRSGSIGTVYHPFMTPWLRELVKDFFLEQRAATPLRGDDD